jgi:hypothetical protein
LKYIESPDGAFHEQILSPPDWYGDCVIPGMRNLAKASTLLILILLAGASTASAQITVRIGPPPPPRVVYVQPARPAGNVVWINGYW